MCVCGSRIYRRVQRVDDDADEGRRGLRRAEEGLEGAARAGVRRVEQLHSLGRACGTRREGEESSTSPSTAAGATVRVPVVPLVKMTIRVSDGTPPAANKLSARGSTW